MRHGEQGNVLFYILIAVALLAALSFAVSRTSTGSVNKVTEDKARIYATGILEYANIINAATAQLRLRGCSETEISFENDVVSGYTNANSPSDNSCHIFNASGGGVQWRVPETTWLDATQSAETDYGNIFFPDGSCVYNVGTDSATLCNTSGSDEELLLIVPWLDIEVCRQINDLIGITNPSNDPPQDDGSAWEVGHNKFTGSYGGDTEIGGVTYTELDGKTAGCFEGTTVPAAGSYHFYKVLIAR